MSHIYHIDCNSFYVACHDLFDPSQHGKPVVVLSNNDGCVVAVNPAGKQLGITRGMASFEAIPILKHHNGRWWSSQYGLYADISERVMLCLARFSDDMEPYSIDEAFVRAADSQPETLAREMKTLLKRVTGIDVSIGVGATKTLAKAANKIAKKDPTLSGICDLSNPITVDAALAHLPVGDVWGIGPRHAAFLAQSPFVIMTARDLKYVPERWIRATRGVTVARTLRELRGEECVLMHHAPPPKKSIMASRSFNRDVTTYQELREAIATYTSRVGLRLRLEGTRTHVLQIFIATSHFATNTPRYANAITLGLGYSTNDSRILARAALTGLDTIYRDGYAYRRAGVMALDLTAPGATQLGLFQGSPEDIARGEAVMAAMDNINRRWGTDTIRLAASGIERQWQTKRQWLSPSYTTRWADVPLAYAA